MGKDWNAKGQHDQKKSRKDDWADIISTGGSSPSCNPPRDSDNRKKYNSGWNNSKGKSKKQS